MPPFRLSRGQQRLLGMTLIATAVLGLVISLVGLVVVGYAGARAQAALQRQVTVGDNALAATSDGLAIAETSLGAARRTVSNLSSVVGNVSQAVSDTEPGLVALQDLLGKQLPETIASTQVALDGAAETAAIVDGVLGALSLFGVRYDPEVPLNVAIDRVSRSLAAVPPSLDTVAAGLGTTTTQLGTIASDLVEVEQGLQAIAADLSDAARVIDQYQAVVSDLQAELATLRTTAPGWIRVARWGGTVLLVWLGLAQLGLLTQGWQLLAQGQERWPAERDAQP
ncbi:MAG: hypothetical protein HXY37_10140 [Chloroflexi bacterium]|nr:hypothetical protein [Chloroflexota bacterium]